MRKAKLTLSIDPLAVKKARKHFRLKHLSLSHVIENFFNSIPEEHDFANKWGRHFIISKNNEDSRLEYLLKKHGQK